MNRALRCLLAAPLLLAALLAGAGHAAAGDPDALWKLISERCVPDYTASRDPAPCTEVDLPADGPDGWVVLKDRDGDTQYLVMPTQKITGIEDPAILAPGEPNFFAAAWAARSFFLDKVGRTLPRSAIALAINSPYGRSQNQLHIHIDCIRTDVAARLSARLGEIGTEPMPMPLLGHAYRVRRLAGPELVENPFLVLAGDPGVGAANMRLHTLVVVGETFPDGQDGFVLLDDRVDVPLGDRASGEELQDHACAIARAG